MSDEAPSVHLVRSAPAQVPADRMDYSPIPAEPAATRRLERNASIIRRYKWLIMAIVVLSSLGGLAASRMVRPKYEVAATVWIQSEKGDDRSGPTRELLNSAAWVELLTSYRITDAVVRKLNLYVKPFAPSDSTLFKDFRIADKFVPGVYELQLDRAAQRWTLLNADEQVIDRGAAGDSVGTRLGLRWKVPQAAFAEAREPLVRFSVSTPRETAIGLIDRLDTKLPDGSNFLALKITDENPVRAQTILNTWTKEFVDVAAELKKRNVVQFANSLRGELSSAEGSLTGAERALQNFRSRTITLPTDGGTPGSTSTSDPALRSYFDQKVQYADIRGDREALQRAIAGARTGRVPWESVLLIPSVAQSAGADGLRDAFKQLQAKRAELLSKQQIFTDRHPAVVEIASGIQSLETETIPRLASQLLSQLGEREDDYNRRISGASRELESIPSRTTEDMRLRRAVTVSEGLYTTLKTRYSDAQLAEASATPDVVLLDSAIAPAKPTKNASTTVLAIAILGGLGAAIGLALMLDATDRKIRYPEQVSDGLGLPIAGAIPLFPKGGVDARSPEQATQLVEAIRSVRMHLLSSSGAPVSVAISSPSPGDGKSFLAANLALSFAEAGHRTLLVDADTRRGKLHEIFELPMGPGLTDYLSNNLDLDSVIRQTSTERLSVLSCGKRRRASPELLTSAGLPALAAELRQRFDVVLFDTPPLAAGVDAYAVASAAQNLALVFRIGKTKRRIAAAKVALIDRLPINLAGAVLNGVELKGEFESYQYAYGYDAYDEEESRALVTTR